MLYKNCVYNISLQLPPPPALPCSTYRLLCQLCYVRAAISQSPTTAPLSPAQLNRGWISPYTSYAVHTLHQSGWCMAVPSWKCLTTHSTTRRWFQYPMLVTMQLWMWHWNSCARVTLDFKYVHVWVIHHLLCYLTYLLYLYNVYRLIWTLMMVVPLWSPILWFLSIPLAVGLAQVVTFIQYPCSRVPLFIYRNLCVVMYSANV